MDIRYRQAIPFFNGQSVDLPSMRNQHSQVINIRNHDEFEACAIELFNEQVQEVDIYRRFCESLRRTQVNSIKDIPFLPISFFKSHRVLRRGLKSQVTFLSSGTGSTGRSKHHLADLQLYERAFRSSFENAYGDIYSFTLLALLPSYQENGDSSLIYMCDQLMKEASSQSQYIKVDQASASLVESLQNEKVIIIGVSYALLELATQYPMDLKGVIMMETGGMKGRGKELVREELHQRLKQAFNLDMIHSEYGMTELLSQAYSKGNGLFESPAWMKVLIRSTTDPFEYVANGKSGGINIIDLANRDSCAFISTQDLGKNYADNRFEVLGRFDNSDIRGCNLLSL